MARFNINIDKEDLADAISDLDHSEIIGLFLRVLDLCAVVELDEELVARIWPTIQGAYEDGAERPTLESLLAQYPCN